MNTEENKVSAKERVIAALGWIIFLIPLVLQKKSEFAVYHANKSFLSLVVASLLVAFGRILPSFFQNLVLSFAYLIFFIGLIYGVFNALKGKKKTLPIFEKVNFIKIEKIF